MEKMSKIIKPILLVLFFAIILTSYMAGGMYAKYKANNDASDEARVAKWKITHLDEDGQVLDLDLGFSEQIISTETGTSGNWLFEIQNESEVVAMLNTDSVIRIELHHENFPELTNKTWDFLKSATNANATNPINFTVEILNGSVDEVTTVVDGVRVLKNDSNIRKLVVQTNGNDTLTEGLTTGTKKRYYYIEYRLSDVFTSSEDISKYLQFGINSNTAKTVSLSWTVDAQTSTGNNNNNSGTDDTNTYTRYMISNTAGSTVVGSWENIEYNNSVETIYLNSSVEDFADYFLYSTGEPSFTVTSGTSQTIVSYSELIKNSTYLSEVTSRSKPTGDNVTYEDIKLYMESLEYVQYKKFLEDYTKFIESYGYIQYGISIKIGFNLNIVQVD